MRRFKLKRVLMGGLATVLAFSTSILPSFALIKEVKVWGAYSINDIGNSDNLITMQELKDDYSDFLQSDGLSEYFHQDKERTTKQDLGEALSWLIDNEIISRDTSVRVANAGVLINSLPLVSITKMDISEFLYRPVTRSDGIMYIYKSAFGPVDARTIGVESANIRVDDGVKMTLYDMMIKHEYFKTIAAGNTGGIIQNEPGDGGTGEGGLYIPPIAIGGDGHDGQHAGSQELTTAINTSSLWRYTPQGDEYTSIFGDTNIFISDVDIEQNIDQTQNGTTGSYGGGGIGGPGGNNQAIQYETDYKQVYFTIAADLMFYRTNDVLEVYLQNALDKGLLGRESHLRTDKFTSTFVNVDKEKMRHWSRYATPFIVNRVKSQLRVSKDIESKPMKDILGQGFVVDYTGGNLLITRRTPFASESGFFSDERFTKMDAYKYIYDFIYANEKKLSQLEVDILNYKYGTELQGCSAEEDKKVLQYLIAMGILDFDNFEDFQNIYDPITYRDLVPILYRVANKNARLDFSKIQLTDSEKAWQAAGFSQTTYYVTSESTASRVSFEYSDEYYEKHGDPALEGSNPAGNVGDDSRAVTEVIVARDYIGSSDGATPLDVVATVANYDDYQSVELGAPTPGGQVSMTGPLGDTRPHGYSLSMDSLKFCSNDTLKKYVSDIFDELVEKLIAASGVTDYDTAMAVVEPIVERDTYSNIYNLFVAASVQSGYVNISTIKSDIDSVAQAAINRVAQSSNNVYVTSAVAQARDMLKAKLDMLSAMGSTGCAFSSIQFYCTVDGVETTYKAINAMPGASMEDKARYFARNVSGISAQVKTQMAGIILDQAMYIRPVEPNSGRTDIGENDAFGTFLPVANARIYTIATSVTMEQAETLSQQQIVEYVRATVGSEATDTAIEENRGLVTQENDIGSNGFISWAQIDKYNSQVDAENQLPISRVSELVLRNDQTNTYAYFSMDLKDPKAVVGTTIVRGDHERGVAYRDGSGTSATLWYSINVIRLLLNAKQESSLLSGVSTLNKPSKAVQDNLTMVPLDSEGATGNQFVVGLRFMMEQDDAVASKNIPQGSIYHDQSNRTYLGMRWGDYVSLSQANRVANVISRRITFNTKQTQKQASAYAVVVFKPTNVTSLGTEKVNKATSMQDLLDSPASMPSDAEGQELWAKNKQACNVFCNWVYGTAGQTYIETGYLVPHVYLYAVDVTSINEIPDVVFKGLTGEYLSKAQAGVHFMAEKQVGACCKIGTLPKATSTGSILSSVDYKASYYISDNYEVVVCGDRVYMHVKAMPGLTPVVGPNSYRLKAGNKALASAAFQVGGTFRLTGYNTSMMGLQEPKATVVNRASDGTITCQLGPIIGLPVRFGGATHVVAKDAMQSTPLNPNNYSSWPAMTDRMATAKAWLHSNAPGSKVLSIASNPLFTPTSVRFVYDGTKIGRYAPGVKSRTPTSTQGYSCDIAGAMSLQTFYEDLNNSSNKFIKDLGWDPATTHTYLEFSFSSFDYTIRNGFLFPQSATAGDFLSPDLFTCINDLIIDQMIDESMGAIPINEVPDGALVQIGSGYYCADTTDGGNTKVFVGYSQLPITSTVSYTPTVQDASMSFGGHNILAGNQYVNISHFFEEFTYLKPTSVGVEDKTGSSVSTFNNALQTVAKNKMTDPKMAYIAIPWAGDNNGAKPYTIQAAENDRGDGDASFYAPVLMRMSNLLSAYPTSGEGDAVKTYTIVNHTNSNIAGALKDLPFYTESVLDAQLNEATTSLLMSGFKTNVFANDFYQAFIKDFEKAFAGDLFTLARLLVFLVLIWLFVISWVCYIFNLGRLMPIVDALRHPTRKGDAKGIDVFKIISLGTISVDSEFKLGRFMAYDAIIAILLLIVWKVGSLPLFG